MKNIGLNKELNNPSNTVSQSGTSGECALICFVGMLVIAVVLALIAVTGCAADSDERNAVTPDISASVSPSDPTLQPNNSSENDNAEPLITPPLPEYPIIDGSSSTITMHGAIKAYLIDEYILPWHSQTYAAIERLVPGNDDPADVVLAVKYYDETLQDLESRGADLVITPIAKEGFVFIVHKDNPVDSLTQEQLRDIYSGIVTNWQQVGGIDEEIAPFTRNMDSGSQTAMEDFMQGLPMIDDERYVADSMIGMIGSVEETGRPAIGYNIYSWVMEEWLGDDLELLSVDGISPSNETLADDSYPLLVYTYSYYNDGNAKGETLTDWLLTDEGQKVIASAGYVGIFGELPPNETIDFNKDVNDSFDVAWSFYQTNNFGSEGHPSACITDSPQIEELSNGKGKSMTVLWITVFDNSTMRFMVLTREKDGVFEMINEGEALDFDGENIVLLDNGG